VLGRRAPRATVWAVDVNRRALALCAGNATANGAPNVRPAGPEEVPATVRFDAIYANPPIRIGKAALHELLARWLGRLAPDGRAWLVVHKHLGADSLARWLTAAGHPTRRLRSRVGYRLLEVSPCDR
jgi:16S rRNA (guanine1207-N2)-methyltransferase